LAGSHEVGTMSEDRAREDGEPGEDDAEREGGHHGERPPAGPALRAKRAALAIVMVVSVVFIGSSTWQIIPAVFGVGFEPIPSGAAAGSPEAQCGAGIHSLAQALDRVGDRMSSLATAEDDSTIMASLRPALSPEWDRADTVRAVCDSAAGGPSAWAALERLRVAEEQSGRLDRDAVSSVRRDVTAHLPAELR
jgi:hypothetical protein